MCVLEQLRLNICQDVKYTLEANVLDGDAYDEAEYGYNDDADDAKNMRIYGVACGQE